MTSPEAAPARADRPGAITVAYWLQLATVVVLLAVVCAAVIEAVRYNALIDDVLRQVPDADPTEVSEERSGNLFMALFIGVPALLLAGWLAATALPLRRRSNVARILVFVAAGVQLLLCLGQGCGGLMIPLAFFAGMGDPGYDSSGGDLPDDGGDWRPSEFLDTLYARGDSMQAVTAVVAGIGILLVLALTVAVVVLLLLPESRRWFRGDSAMPAAGPWPAFGYGYGYGPAQPQPGQPGWVALPPGYLICPDPALHIAHPPTYPTAPVPTGADATEPPPADDRAPRS
ncbi:hypothetical protein ACL02O_18115 [Micromonospora sp. MS34]|uniref:hypothetical protein n=1 Tax=Micromonospora sp. MS34 TaxID=3385971 RepID=UPI0039A070D4